jgi:hypothetical protein
MAPALHPIRCRSWSLPRPPADHPCLLPASERPVVGPSATGRRPCPFPSVSDVDETTADVSQVPCALHTGIQEPEHGPGIEEANLRFRPAQPPHYRSQALGIAIEGHVAPCPLLQSGTKRQSSSSSVGRNRLYSLRSDVKSKVSHIPNPFLRHAVCSAIRQARELQVRSG